MLNEQRPANNTRAPAHTHTHTHTHTRTHAHTHACTYIHALTPHTSVPAIINSTLTQHGSTYKSVYLHTHSHKHSHIKHNPLSPNWKKRQQNYHKVTNSLDIGIVHVGKESSVILQHFKWNNVINIHLWHGWGVHKQVTVDGFHVVYYWLAVGTKSFAHYVPGQHQ